MVSGDHGSGVERALVLFVLKDTLIQQLLVKFHSIDVLLSME